MVVVKLHKRLNHQRIADVDLGLDVEGLLRVECRRYNSSAIGQEPTSLEHMRTTVIPPSELLVYATTANSFENSSITASSDPGLCAIRPDQTGSE